MRDYDQNYLELATDYMNSGMYNDALEILSRFLDLNKGKVNPLIHYYLGYFNAKLNNADKEKEHYEIAAGLPTDYCFPFRIETATVLNASLEKNNSDSHAYYYLGNLFYDKDPAKAMSYWRKCAALNDRLAICYRNLGWGAYRHEKNIPQAISYYEKAISIKKDDPVYYYEIDRLYELANTDPETRLALLEPNHEILIKRDDSFLREIMVLNLTGHYQKSVGYLSENYFHIREGDMKIRDIHVDAHLLLGKEYLNKGNFDQAIEHFALANTHPENHQAGRQINDHRVAQIMFYSGLCSEKNGKKPETYYKQCISQQMGISPY
ncbi:MAG: tetratricopeptide repeat protein, partial [Bacteroidales bacterium]|nr:tetratricopeptide repeat protein [Bacteroidales bacterium]